MVDWWEYPTNYSGGKEIDGAGRLFMDYPNFIMTGGFGAGITLLIFIVTFGLSMSSGSRKSLAVASFISFIFSLYFVRLGAINLTITISLILLTIIGSLGAKEEP
jgi:hypothetical protein